ncbi:aldo/keto reductase [Chondromyces apiculatus]|uniref:Putative oxidoreductase n=1 Tax=Chondromyces apiculatus DSM 436 TaxID=1192034 RepID=A0A017T3U5_9BACT|nr:aldo/keto reductase [Chondromyces apiculatus]EYF03652.1 putative oxidoreductase [Chondromyces apiculatus DSM 436]
MQYTRLGNSGLVVSRLAFGAMTFGAGKVPAVYKVDEATARAMVDRALDAGVNFFDTADVYNEGASERMLGQILGARRKDVVIATKVGMRMGEGLAHTGLSRRHILASVEGSLERLGTDYIDLYLVHRFDPHTPIEETLDALDQIVRRGLVRYVGYSNWAAWQSAKAVGLQERHGQARFVAAQMYYSLVCRDLEHEVLPFAQDAGIGTMIWSPLAGGFLSGKYTRENLKDADNRLSGFDVLQHDKEEGFRLVDAMRPIAEAHRATVAQVALAWLLTRPGVSTLVVGASKLHQLDDNLGAVEVALTAEDIQKLDALSPHTSYYPQWFTAMVRDGAVDKALGLA